MGEEERERERSEVWGRSEVGEGDERGEGRGKRERSEVLGRESASVADDPGPAARA